MGLQQMNSDLSNIPTDEVSIDFATRLVFHLILGTVEQMWQILTVSQLPRRYELENGRNSLLRSESSCPFRNLYIFAFFFQLCYSLITLCWIVNLALFGAQICDSEGNAGRRFPSFCVLEAVQ